METTTKKTDTTGKTTKKKETTTKVAKDDTLALLMKQIEEMRQQLEQQKEEKNGMEQLIEALKGTQAQSNGKVLSQKVKVVSLISNTLVLSTEEFGGGTVFTFKKFGDIVTMRTSQLEQILSIQGYRRQAEDMLFYICDADIVEDQDLTDYYDGIDKSKIEYITSLTEDNCIDLLCGLSEGLRTSITTSICENIAKGMKYDRNRLAIIKEKLNIDIESIAEELKRVESKKAK